MKSTGDIKIPVGANPDKAVADILAELRSMGSEENRTGMARYGINVENAFGVSVYHLRKIAKRLGTDHALALALWATGNHEARLLACFVDDPSYLLRLCPRKIRRMVIALATAITDSSAVPPIDSLRILFTSQQPVPNSIIRRKATPRI
jgi:hypothetical protein